MSSGPQPARPRERPPRRFEPVAQLSAEGLAAEMAKLARAADPEWHALLDLSNSPLPELEPRDAARFGHRLDDDPLIVPRAVIAAIREHAVSVKDGHEVVGELIVRRGVATRYARLENLSRTPGTFRTRRRRPPAGESRILVHSHGDGSTTPSRRDLDGASPRVLRESYAIFEAASGQLSLFKLAADRASFTPLPVEIVDEPRDARAAMRLEGSPPSPVVRGQHLHYDTAAEAAAAMDELYADGLPPGWPQDWPRPGHDAVPLDPGAARHLHPIRAAKDTQERRRREMVEVEELQAAGKLPSRNRVRVLGADEAVRWIKALGKSQRPRR